MRACRRGSRSIQFANHHYPNAESFPGVRIRCYIGSTCRGEPLGIGSFFRKDLAGLKMTYEVTSRADTHAWGVAAERHASVIRTAWQSCELWAFASHARGGDGSLP